MDGPLTFYKEKINEEIITGIPNQSTGSNSIYWLAVHNEAP